MWLFQGVSEMFLYVYGMFCVGPSEDNWWVSTMLREGAQNKNIISYTCIKKQLFFQTFWIYRYYIGLQFDYFWIVLYKYGGLF